MSDTVKPLSIDQLRRVCDPAQFDFKSTEELSSLDEVLGQDRAVKAVSFGIDIESPGYNMYALGPPGTGKTTTIQKFLKRKSSDQPVPDDWCYINNFEDEDKPKSLRLPAGMGCELEKDMSGLVQNLETDIPRAFESEDYDTEQENVQKKFQQKRQDLFSNLEDKASEKGFRLLQTPRGIVLAPVVDGEVLTNEQFNELDKEKQEEIRERQEELQEQMRDTVRQVQGMQQDVKDEMRELDKQVVGYAVHHLIDELTEKYSEIQGVIDYLEACRKDILENVENFKKAKQMEQAQQQMPIPLPQQSSGPTFDKYRVNLIVDHCDTEGAPVVVESNPTYGNLIGKMEHQARFGALLTNFQMIKAGALHTANGGYLMVDANDILTKPLAWEGLKRSLRDGEIKMESPYQGLGMISTRSLDPEPIPLDVKVIVTGNPMIYYLLYSLDPDFQELFKVKADFATQMDWAEDDLQQYAKFIGTICNEEGLNHFSPSGVAKVIEHSSRMVSDREKLSTNFGNVVDLITQSSYWAGKNGNHLVQGKDVTKAINEQIYRSNKLEERIQEMIEDETILIDTEGDVEGQVNGISILPLGDYMFGKPSRITARTYVGKAGVVNIDRETELGGRIHNKGVMILTGFLGGKFAKKLPLAFSASVTFEQLYEEVEGDSASSAELYALLSSLSGFPIRQDFAVTGSVNQRGQVQAIGGVNQKIEGFFDVCKIKGLNGEQGVLIPRSNVKHLMLREDVIEEIDQGNFHIYPVSRIDEGIEILTGIPAGETDDDGAYPEGTVYYEVNRQLRELADRVQKFGREKESANGQGEVESV